MPRTRRSTDTPTARRTSDTPSTRRSPDVPTARRTSDTPSTRRSTLAAAASSDPADRRSLCPVACALDVVGDRWTLLIVRDLFAGKKRFGDFLTSQEHIPTNILAERLKRLERAGLVTSVAYSEHPPRYDYHLTPDGRDLRPVVEAIATWGLAQFPGTRRPARPKNQSAHVK